MFSSFIRLIFNLAPLSVLVIVLVASFKMVQSDGMGRKDTRASDSVAPVATLVQPQAVVVEANASVESPRPEIPATTKVAMASPAVAKTGNAGNKDQVWVEINDAISGLNDLVGANMFLDVKRSQKGQMEITLDENLWKRVRYQTRVDLKTDISNLWHLYVTEYAYADSSVVYFLGDGNGRVIDIFSKAN